ncbi:PDR/VanB family oxidoreductase [Paenarthrobacter sp. NPDC056912]|uniref:PDR/VanB family oxidoreductase n=1 Tax=Paenarthrobacter sp. NPDC056912 TaxID=3345965 RepID=UPI00366E9AD9
MPEQPTIEVLVDRIEWPAEDIVVARLVHPDGKPLPRWTAGAHIDVVLPSGLVRQYSLCGDPADPNEYRIAVLRVAEGRGGSRELHDSLQEGQLLAIRGPRNNFELQDADEYLFVAGGIGITPILPMLLAAQSRGARSTVFYGGRTRRSMAYVEELHDVADAVVIAPKDVFGRLDLADIVSRAKDVGALYCCGPEPLLSELESRVRGADCPIDLRLERFQANDVDAPNTTFQVMIQSTGALFHIPPDRSILEVLREKDVDVLYSCEEGTCGSCETGVIEGEPEHRDAVLMSEERDQGKKMMICVSRARCDRLVLDL